MKMMAFEEFEEISKLSGTPDKHRAWLKRYEGLNYSIALEGRHWMKWQTEPKEYRDGQFATNINCIGRRKDEVRIEFDGDEKKAKDDLEKTANRLKELGIGFIRSTHKGKSDYLWVQFDRNVSDKEAEAFLAWIAPIGSEVDLNFASSNKVFPVLFAIHWKHSYQRELPVEFFLGKKIVLEEFGIKPKGKIGSIKKTADGFSYKTFNKEAGMVFAPSGQASLFSSAQPLFYDKAENWWLWNFAEYRWQMVDEIDILNMIFEATGRDIISPKERTIILNSLKQEGRKNIPEDIKKSWIQFKDKFFDIMNGDEVEVTPKYFAVNPIPYALHKERFTQTPTMDRIFEEWDGKDYVQTLYEILAYCLIPDYPIHRLFCLIGSGMNGKSCFLRLLKKFIGNGNITATELDTLLNSRFEVTRLFKKLVCIMGETNFSEMSKTSIIKKLTGQDVIGLEYKNKTPFDDCNYAKIIIATNNLPSTTDKTIGFYRRWMIIDFPNQFSEQKDILADIPEEEFECLTLKCALILKDLLERRSFTNEGSLEDRMEKYEAKSNFLEKFIKEATIEDFNGNITCSDFNKKFWAWCKEHRHREMSETSIGIAMKKVGFIQERKYFSWMFDGRGGQARVWTGLTWK